MSGLISNGTYVLGDPNTRDLYLGKGLKDGFEGDKYYIATDETVLWEGNINVIANASFTLSESAENFERIRVYFGGNNGTRNLCMEFLGSSTSLDCMRTFWNTTSDVFFDGFYFESTDHKNFTCLNGTRRLQYKSSGWTFNTYSSMYFQKVVGINRKREEV